MSAYIRQLELHCTAPLPPRLPTLEEQFEQWWASQPLATRSRAYSMQELEKALVTQGRYLSPILVKRGWVRHRCWQHRQHYFRVWLPPDNYMGIHNG